MDQAREWEPPGRMVLRRVLSLVAYLAVVVVIVDVLGGGIVFTLLVLGGVSLVQYCTSDTRALRSMGRRGGVSRLDRHTPAEKRLEPLCRLERAAKPAQAA